MKVIEINLPEISVCCPKCDDEMFIPGGEFEVNTPKYFGVASTYCDECDHSFTVGLTN